jgi:hypothetical protein
MAILTFPSIVPETFTFGINYRTQVSTSNISGITQTVEIPGARWHGNMSFSDMTKAESADLKAFLLELRGSAGRFYYSDITHTQTFTPITGSLTIAGGSTRSVIRVTTTSGSFTPGDYIHIDTTTKRELKMVIASTLISGSTYDLVIEPTIRMETFIGKVVDYTNPLGVFVLTSSDQAKWNVRGKASLSNISLDFMEMFVL